MRHLFVLFATLLLLSISIVHAQEATATPDTLWPVVEQCMGAPTKPPQDWSYDGTILMTGYAGIHGVNTKWDTPRVLVFLGEKDIFGGALSPDGKWYASPIGWTEYTDGNNTVTTTDKMGIYSTLDSKLSHRIPWISPTVYNGSFGQVYWRDNDHFIYPAFSGWQLVDISTDNVTAWNKSDKIYDAYDPFMPRFAPDWSKIIYYNHDSGNGTATFTLRDIASTTDIATLDIKRPILWKPDSTGFVANISANKTNEDSIPNENLALFNNQGALEETIFTPPAGQQIGSLNKAWSSDSRYFAFITFAYTIFQGKFYLKDFDAENTLYILDTKQQRVINTCLQVDTSFTWSLEGHKLAFVQPKVRQQSVQIYDLEIEKVYSVAYHSGSVIGWRAN